MKPDRPLLWTQPDQSQSCPLITPCLPAVSQLLRSQAKGFQGFCSRDWQPNGSSGSFQIVDCLQWVEAVSKHRL
jgi:hypothetical protein